MTTLALAFFAGMAIGIWIIQSNEPAAGPEALSRSSHPERRSKASPALQAKDGPILLHDGSEYRSNADGNGPDRTGNPVGRRKWGREAYLDRRV